MTEIVETKMKLSIDIGATNTKIVLIDGEVVIDKKLFSSKVNFEEHVEK